MMESLSETLFQLVNIKTLTASQNSLDFKELEHLHLQIIVKLSVWTQLAFLVRCIVKVHLTVMNVHLYCKYCIVLADHIILMK